MWRKLFDVRKGEYARTLFMSLYLLCVMVAYYILKPVSAAMFLNKFNIDKLPYLYILIAVAGGFLAYLYTRIALKSSLTTAVSWTMLISVICLIALWWLIGLNLPWMLYVFNIWVSLFSIVLFSQGWLVAANLFDSRQAKRLYGLLGLGAVVGAAVGSAVTTLTVRIVGTRNLILACAAIVALAFGAFLGAIRQSKGSLTGARAADTEKQEFSPRDIFASIARNRHLQLIIAITLLTFIVDELVDFQFQAVAKRSFHGDQLTAFIASFFVYLNLISLVLQLFFTAWIVRRIGVGGTLQIMPLSITAASIAAAAVPGLVSAIILRFSEAVNRYTFNRTGMELLFLPLPSGLKNRTKAFIDIFIDRFGRGLAGVLLATLLALGLRNIMQIIAVMTVGCTAAWIFLARAAAREYTRTMRSRIERRRLELEDARLTVGDPATLQLLEQTLESTNTRQVCYALSMLAEAPGYDLAPVLTRLSTSPMDEVRATVYDLATALEFPGLLTAAIPEIQDAAGDPGAAVVVPKAVAYVIAVSAEAADRAAEFVNHANPVVVEAAIEAMNDKAQLAPQVLTHDWIAAAAGHADTRRRKMAALAIAVRGQEHANELTRLLQDDDNEVVAAACRAAGKLGHRASVEPMIKRLDDPALRSVVIESLAAFGARHCGLLGDCLMDPAWPLATRCQIPRVLKLIQDQRSADVLLHSLDEPEISIRIAVLRALSHLHETAPRLNYGATFVTDHILKEARHYFELYSAVEPFHDQKGTRTAAGLLERSLQERLQQTLERLFRLLGLKYPPEDMHAAYLAVRGRRREQFLAALDFLDTVLEPALKRVVLPLLDSSEGMTERGRDLFGLEVRDAESAMRDLIRSSDPWLSACAMAAAAERRFHRLRADILAVGQRAGTEVAQVANSAVEALALNATAD
jgi:AAA family ATP:ADP antiporter